MADRFRAKADDVASQMIAAALGSECQVLQGALRGRRLSDAREAIGYIPWMFDLAEPEHAEAWRQINDPAGFWHLRPDHGRATPPGFSHSWHRHLRMGRRRLAVRHKPNAQRIGQRACAARSRTSHAAITSMPCERMPAHHRMDGKPYIGEYHDEITGDWLITGPKAARSRDYNHSTFCDLVISGLVGLVPRDEDDRRSRSAGAAEAWDWFCLDGVPYHGTIVDDRLGSHWQALQARRRTGNLGERYGNRAVRKLDSAGGQVTIRCDK